MPIFRIAHITDLHFGSVGGWYNPVEEIGGSAAQNKRALRSLYAGRQQHSISQLFYPSSFDINVAVELHAFLQREYYGLDAIVATGDLATTGEKKDIELAKDYFAGDFPTDWTGIQAIQPTQSLLKDENLLFIGMPGNHDRYLGLAKTPGSPHFETYFGDHWDCDRDHTSSLVGCKTNRVRFATLEKDNAALAIIAADFSLDSSHASTGGFAYIGQGRVISDALTELKVSTRLLQQLYDQTNTKLFIIWAVHFPPLFPNCIPELDLLNSQELVDAASDQSVSLILSGHTHCTLHYTIVQNNRPIKVQCAGPSCGLSSHLDFGLSVIEVDFTTHGGFAANTTYFKWDGSRFTATPLSST